MSVVEFAKKALLGTREHLETALARTNDAIKGLEEGEPGEAGKNTARAWVSSKVAVQMLDAIQKKLMD